MHVTPWLRICRDPEAARRQEIQAQVDRLEAAFREAQSETKEAAAELR